MIVLVGKYLFVEPQVLRVVILEIDPEEVWGVERMCGLEVVRFVTI